MKRKISGDTLSVMDDNDNVVLTIKGTSAEKITKLVVTGNITHDVSPDFEDELMSILIAGHDVAVDFSMLDHISAPALKTLLTIQKLAEEKNFKFYINKISNSVKETFEQTGFIDLLDIRDK